jgi:hypothetical protein
MSAALVVQRVQAKRAASKPNVEGLTKKFADTLAQGTAQSPKQQEPERA